ncbi:enoyl-CoA hydratase-related protein [Blastococcus sp. SYSU DS0616]
MSDEPVKYRVHADVAYLTLSVPDRRNALSAAGVTALLDGVRRALAADQVRFVVLTGTGTTFCAGADMKEQRARHAAGEAATTPVVLPELLTLLWESPKPVVGRINGHARAAGMALLGACDIAVAVEEATFSFSEVRVGLAPAVVAVTTVPRMPPRAALELMLTGEEFPARRAVEVGLLNAAVPTGDLDEAVDRYLAMLRLGAPAAVGVTKHVLRRVGTLSMGQAFDEMSELSVSFFSSEEGQEGMRAFQERRRPRWAS